MSLEWIDLEDEKQFDGYPDLFHAVVADDIEELRACLREEPVWTTSILNHTRSVFDGMTPVHLACVRASRKVFEEMLSDGKPFDPFVVDGLGRRAIDYAIAFRRDDMARALQARMYPDGFAKLRQHGAKPPAGPA